MCYGIELKATLVKKTFSGQPKKGNQLAISNAERRKRGKNRSPRRHGGGKPKI